MKRSRRKRRRRRRGKKRKRRRRKSRRRRRRRFIPRTKWHVKKSTDQSHGTAVTLVIPGCSIHISTCKPLQILSSVSTSFGITKTRVFHGLTDGTRWPNCNCSPTDIDKIFKLSWDMGHGGAHLGSVVSLWIGSAEIGGEVTMAPVINLNHIQFQIYFA